MIGQFKSNLTNGPITVHYLGRYFNFGGKPSDWLD